MKKIIIIAILATLITGCAPFQVEIAIFQKNNYTLANPCDDYNSSNNVVRTSEQSGEAVRSYGNNNRAVVKQSIVMYRSPVTNSSNSVPITLPLMGAGL